MRKSRSEIFMPRTVPHEERGEPSPWDTHVANVLVADLQATAIYKIDTLLGSNAQRRFMKPRESSSGLVSWRHGISVYQHANNDGLRAIQKSTNRHQ